MTTYNENLNFLKACIDSILKQTYKNFEFIIVTEPGETNIDYLENVERLDKRVKILKNNTKLGVSSSRNMAIVESSGRYIAMIDGDDYCDLMRLGKQLEFLDSNPEVSLVGSNMYLIDEDNNIMGERKYPELNKDIKQNFLLTMAIANPTVIVRRKDIEDIGLFDSRLSKAEDFDLWLRFMAKNKKMHNLQENLVYYRVKANHSEKRGSIHWRNNYIARKRYSKLIWPFHERFFSLCLFFIISRIPEFFLDSLFNLQIVNKLKGIKAN
jgi:glycosyltransferase involved in cell wall biosynthesis